MSDLLSTVVEEEKAAPSYSLKDRHNPSLVVTMVLTPWSDMSLRWIYPKLLIHACDTSLTLSLSLLLLSSVPFYLSSLLYFFRAVYEWSNVCGHQQCEGNPSASSCYTERARHGGLHRGWVSECTRLSWVNLSDPTFHADLSCHVMSCHARHVTFHDAECLGFLISRRPYPIFTISCHHPCVR